MRTESEELVVTFIDELYKLNMPNNASHIQRSTGKVTIVIPEIDVEMTKITSYGIVNESNIIVNAREYRLQYHRTWPDWTLNDSNKRRFGGENFHISGDLAVVRDHLTYIKLRK